MSDLQNYISTLTDRELKTTCKSFYHKAEAKGNPADMLIFNETFKAIKSRLNRPAFEAYCVSL